MENPIAPNETADIESRLTIAEYRLDLGDTALHALRTEYTQEHQALRISLQGIEKNLQAIKWVAVGIAVTFLAQIVGLERAFAVLATIL